MTRYSHLTRLLPLGALAAAGVMALSAAPAGATLVCQAGHTPSPTSPYCTNVPPTATTNDATNVKPKRATLNGVAGPNVVGGDPTSYFFQCGTNDGLRQPDADPHDRLLPQGDHPSEPVLHNSKDTGGVGRHPVADTLYDLPLPALRQQSGRCYSGQWR